MTLRVLVIAAHPDDEVLGCGGTVARLADEGAEVHAHILGEGITSRYRVRAEADQAEIQELHERAQLAGRVLGSATVMVHDLPDNRFDELALLDVVKLVEEWIERLVPDTVYTHHGGDLNIDHQIVHRAVLTATRPVGGSPVRDVYAFEVPSSTEWSFQRLEPAFRPNVFVDISETLGRKVQALLAYETEVRPYPHPRSPEAIEAGAHRWGSVAGFQAAEAFELVRSLRR
jgi:LmbE family N-acetylglucosaminyl deacetylase